jgi:hypothetical protein
MFHKFQVSHVTHQYFFLERTWLVYIQDGYGAVYIVHLILFIFIFSVAESIMQAQVYNKSKYFVMSRFFLLLMKQQIH